MGQMPWELILYLKLGILHVVIACVRMLLAVYALHTQNDPSTCRTYQPTPTIQNMDSRYCKKLGTEYSRLTSMKAGILGVWIGLGWFFSSLKPKKVVLAIVMTFWYTHTRLKKIHSGTGSTSILCYG